MRPIALTIMMLALASGAFGNDDMDFQKKQDGAVQAPAEILKLMPAGLVITETNWMVEQSSGMLLSLNLNCVSNGARFDSSSPYELRLSVIMNAYNTGSEVGKMVAQNSLEPMRANAKKLFEEKYRPADTASLKISKPEKTVLKNGFIQAVKIIQPARHDGEGMVPESVSYAAFLYVEVEGGYLTAEIEPIPVKAPLEKWLRQIHTTALALKPQKFFR